MPPDSTAPGPDSAASRLIVVGWEGADHALLQSLLAQGRLPVLRALLARGVNATLRGLGPGPAAQRWTTLLTGHHPAEHGLFGATLAVGDSGAPRPTGPAHRRRAALWQRFSAAGRRAHVIGWPASHPAEIVAGVAVSEAFGVFAPPALASRLPPGELLVAPPESVYPPERAAALAACRVAPSEIEPGLLGWFFSGLEAADLTVDQRPLRLLTPLARLYSLHNASVQLAGELIRPAGPAPVSLLAVHHRFLDDVRREFGRYADAAPETLPDADRRRYAAVVGRACELQDLLLGDLLRAAGPSASVALLADAALSSVSTGLPETTPAWLVAAGPLFGAHRAAPALGGALDLLPTLLHAAALPRDPTLPGQCLPRLVARAATPSVLSSVAPEHPTEQTIASERTSAGRASAPEDPTDAAHLGLALHHAGRHAEALPSLLTAWFHAPEDLELSLSLARCQARLGLVAEAGITAATLRDHLGGGPGPALLLAELALETRAPTAALHYLQEAAAGGAPAASLRFLRALALLALRRRNEAEALAREWCEAEPDGPLPALLRTHLLLEAGDPSAALPLARRARALAPALPLAATVHERVARSLGRSAEDDLAAETAGDPVPENARPLLLPQLDFSQLLPEAPPSPAERLTARTRATFARLLDALAARRVAARAGALLDGPPLALGLPGEWSLRAPWPDERPRLARLFPALATAAGTARVRLLVHRSPERIVGAYALRPVDGAPHGLLAIDVLPAWVGGAAHQALLRAARTEAHAAGLDALTLVLPEDSPAFHACRQAGLGVAKIEHFFEGDPRTLDRRLHALDARARDRLSALSTRPLAPADHEMVAEILAGHGLFNTARARARLVEQRDPRLALVCLREGEIAGVVLLVPQPEARVYVEALAVGERHRSASAFVALRLLHDVLQEVLRARFGVFTLACQPAKDVVTLNLARRLGCRVVERRATLRLDVRADEDAAPARVHANSAVANDNKPVTPAPDEPADAARSTPASAP